MSTTDPREPRAGSIAEPEEIVVVRDETVVGPERTVVIPDVPASPQTVVTRRWVGPAGPDVALLALGFLVLLLVVIALFVWALPSGRDVATGPERTAPVTDTIDPDTNVSHSLALAAPTELRTHTINVSGDQDLLALATGAGSVDGFGGAPATADGVEVTELLGEQAFEVADPSGATMVVYLPYGIPEEVFVTIGQELTFVGSVSTTPEDLTAIADASAATAAAGEGAYIIAVPESVHVVEPSKADATAV